MSLGPRVRSLVRHQIAFGIREDHVTYRLVILDVAGATAEVAIERLGNRSFEIGARHRLLRETLQQDLALVQEAGGAIAALERKMLDECLLQSGELAVLRMALDRADCLAVETRRRHDAGRGGVARPVGSINDHRATQTLRRAAPELGAGHPEVFAQKIVHRETVANIRRFVRAAVDGDAQFGHVSAPLSMVWVTGRDWKRRPVASWMAFSNAGTTGIITTSAMPFGGSSGVTGGNTSISISRSGRSDPRAMRYCPRFHCPLPGPPS